MKNILIGVLVIGILILGYLFIKQKDKVTDTYTGFEFSEETNSSPNSTNQNPPITSNPPVTSTPTTPPPTNPNWTEERFGWYYPPGWEGYSKGNTGDSFGIYNPSSGTGTEIQVGGLPGTKFEFGCEQSQIGDFQYGVSTEACVNGTIVYLSNVSARWVPSQEEKNIFGDFVIRNR